jgi:hypothetical protein
MKEMSLIFGTYTVGVLLQARDEVFLESLTTCKASELPRKSCSFGAQVALDRLIARRTNLLRAMRSDKSMLLHSSCDPGKYV